MPADVGSFRTDDPELAALLSDAGLATNACGPDVEIGGPDSLRGDAAVAAVPIYGHHIRELSPTGRVVARLARGLALSVGLRRAARAARRVGYGSTHTITWERSVPVAAPGLPNEDRSPLAHRFPLNGVLVAGRDDARPTLFDDVLRGAGRAAQVTAHPSAVGFGSSGVVVATLDSVVLRVAVGRCAARIDAQREVVAQLLAGGPRNELSAKIPTFVAGGREGIATWTLEERLPGAHPARLDSTLVEDAVRFLAELGRMAGPGSPRTRVQAAADVVSRECSADVAEHVRRLAGSALEELADRPACFVHGDFWHRNLLVEGGRLTGVVDWSAGGPDGLPMVDVLHLHLSSVRQDTGQPLGPAVAEHLSNRLSTSELVQAYKRLVGLKLTVAEQRALVVAYWLDALARDLRDPDAPRDDRSSWEQDNVLPVLQAAQRP